MKPANEILKSVILTEKSGALTANLNQYTFEVATNATRPAVAYAIEKTYNVTVRRVNILNVKPRPTRGGMRGVPGYSSEYKKAVVTLKEGDKIDLA